MKLIAIFGLAAGAVLAAGNLTAAQWHAAGAGLLALILHYGLTVLPWALAALFARAWWRQRGITQIWYDGCRDWSNEALRAQRAELVRQQQAAQPQRRRRAPR